MPIVETTKEAGRGGYQAIQKIRGKMTYISSEPEKAPWEGDDTQVKVTLSDAAILKMFNDEEEPELKDGTFTFYVPYAKAGKVPHQNSVYMKTWVASAEAMGKKPSEFMNQYVTLERKEVLLFSTDKGEDGKPMGANPDGSKIKREIKTDRYFLFAPDDDDPNAFKNHLVEKLNGMKQEATARTVLLDSQIGQHLDYKQAAKDSEKLAAMLGMKIVDGIFTAA